MNRPCATAVTLICVSAIAFTNAGPCPEQQREPALASVLHLDRGGLRGRLP